MGCSINKGPKKYTNSQSTLGNHTETFEDYLKKVGPMVQSIEVQKQKVSYQIDKNPIIQRRLTKSLKKLNFEE